MTACGFEDLLVQLDSLGPDPRGTACRWTDAACYLERFAAAAIPVETPAKWRHPLSGQEVDSIPGAPDAEPWADVCGWIAQQRGQSIPDHVSVYLLRELRPDLQPWLDRPAEEHFPGASVAAQLRVLAGLRAVMADGRKPAILSFALGPVQPFIESSRSLRDLWAASMILSWLAFQGMEPVLEKFGPGAIVFPTLVNVPFLHAWLHKKYPALGLPKPRGDARIPCLPHRFLAICPWDESGRLALETDVASHLDTAWKRAGNSVRQALGEFMSEATADDAELAALAQDWAKRWPEQIKTFPEIRTAAVPLAKGDIDDDSLAGLAGGWTFGQTFPDLANIRKMVTELTPTQERDSVAFIGRWQTLVGLAARLLESRHSVRRKTDATEFDDKGPRKCTMLGTLEQLGPDELKDSDAFWRKLAERFQEHRLHGAGLKAGERFSVLGLIKRFFGPVFFADEFGIVASELRFEATATVAAGQWIKDMKLDLAEIRRELGKAPDKPHWTATGCTGGPEARMSLRRRFRTGSRRFVRDACRKATPRARRTAEVSAKHSSSLPRITRS